MGWLLSTANVSVSMSFSEPSSRSINRSLPCNKRAVTRRGWTRGEAIGRYLHRPIDRRHRADRCVRGSGRRCTGSPPWSCARESGPLRRSPPSRATGPRSGWPATWGAIGAPPTPRWNSPGNSASWERSEKSENVTLLRLVFAIPSAQRDGTNLLEGHVFFGSDALDVRQRETGRAPRDDGRKTRAYGLQSRVGATISV